MECMALNADSFIGLLSQQFLLTGLQTYLISHDYSLIRRILIVNVLAVNWNSTSLRFCEGKKSGIFESAFVYCIKTRTHVCRVIAAKIVVLTLLL